MKTQANPWTREDVDTVWSVVSANGIDCISDLMKPTGLDPRIIVGIVEEQHIPLNLSLESLAREGVLSLRDISRVTNIGCYEEVRKRMIQEKLHKTWKRARSRFVRFKVAKKKTEKDVQKEKQQVLEEIINGVNVAILNRLKQESSDWAYQKSLDYFMKNTLTRLAFEDILEFLRRYNDCKDQGVKKSLKDLRKGLKISYSQGARILYCVGGEPLYGRKYWVTLTNQDEMRIKRAYSIEMPATDLEYFLEIPLHKLLDKFKEIGERKLCRTITTLDGKPLTYRIASQMFMAEDAGYSDKEMIEEFDINERVLNHFYRHKKEIKETIVNALRVLYGDSKINKPYIISLE